MNRYKVALLVVLLASPALLAHGQSDEMPTREQVLEFMEFMRVPEQTELMINGMVEGMTQGARLSIEPTLAEASPGQKAVFEEFLQTVMSDVREEMAAAEFIEDVVAVYQKYLTRSDLEQLLAFYRSPVGQKVLDLMPVMMQESMQTAQLRAQKKLPALTKKLEKRVEEFKRRLESELAASEQSTQPK